MRETRKIPASEIVASMKSYTQYVDSKFMGMDEIDFLGCSENYVEEKINRLIWILQHLKKSLRSIEKMQMILEKERMPKK